MCNLFYKTHYRIFQFKGEINQTMEIYKNFINGQYVDPVSGIWMDSVDPYSGEIWAQVPQSSVDDAGRAVAAAKQAFDNSEWTNMTASARGKLMRRLGDLVHENRDHLAQLEVRDNGKLLSEMTAQMNYHPEWWYYFGGLADKIEGSIMPIDKNDAFSYTTYEPLGVVAAITAWNSPLLFVAWKCAPALAAGNTVIVKPSEFASASTLAYAELVREAGFPDGVFNVVSGYGTDVGAALVNHPDVAKITFTGSDISGQKIYENAARNIKHVSLELGGKSPNIVFEDADLDMAAKGAVSGIFAATGQTCVAGSRLLVQESIHDEFLSRLIALAKSARIGNPMDSSTHIGPITTRQQYDKVISYIEIAKEEGAELVFGGEPCKVPGGEANQFVKPTIFTNVSNDMRIAQEEVFGPVLSVLKFKDEDEAIRIGNDVVYGLAAGVWTNDIRRAMRFTKALKAGTVWVNTYRAFSYMMPFGGMKRSGLGRESGVAAIRDYLQVKSVWLSTANELPNPFIIN